MILIYYKESDQKHGGKMMTMGEMVKSMLVKLEWFDTRFPRIPVNVQVLHCILHITKCLYLRARKRTLHKNI